MSGPEEGIVSGRIIKVVSIQSVGYAVDNHARNQQKCKNNCDAKNKCNGFIYTTDSNCHMVSGVTGFIPTPASLTEIYYDACMLVM
eukprot:gene31876-7085_t